MELTKKSNHTKKYIGVKMVKALPMNRLDYNIYRGWDLPSDENGTDEGFLVEYVDGGEPNHHDHTGYISWSPRKVFENAYSPVTGISFGLAIEAMKKMMKVTRSIWGDKFIYYNFPEQNPHYTSRPFLSVCENAEELTPWTPTQEDMLATDWVVIITE